MLEIILAKNEKIKDHLFITPSHLYKLICYTLCRTFSPKPIRLCVFTFLTSFQSPFVRHGFQYLTGLTMLYSCVVIPSVSKHSLLNARDTPGVSKPYEREKSKFMRFPRLLPIRAVKNCWGRGFGLEATWGRVKDC